MTRFIVGEVSVNWINGETPDGTNIPIAARFEQMIETNRQRGYRLQTFSLHRLYAPESDRLDGFINETIIAVFEREPS